MTFDQADAQDFLAEPHVAVFSVASPDGPPASVPLWYAYDRAEESVWMLTPGESRKARLLRATGVATLVVDTVEPRTRYVSVDLELTDERAATSDDVRAMASRYLQGEALEGYVAFAAENLSENRLTFHVTKWRYADVTPG